MQTAKSRLLIRHIIVLSLLTFVGLAAPRYWQRTKADNATTTAALPTLRGEAALTHLKERGLYSSLSEAIKAARYIAQPLPQSVDPLLAQTTRLAPGARIRLRVYLKPDSRDAATVIQAVLQPSDEPNQQTTGSAVYALAQGPLGVNQGVWGISLSNIGVGVRGTALHDDVTMNSVGIGVRGNSKSLEGIGVEGVADSTIGENVGVRGESLSETGVGVLGEMKLTSGINFGVKGLNSNPTGRGVLGHATDTNGVNYGVVGRTESPNGFAGFFIGRVHVAGFLSKAAGAFKIDHPLDPENKTLSHSFVESPDMMNIYNGIVTLGKDGAAEVTLPDYFEALNREFRYQLTCIGGFAPVYVAKKMNGNRFRIAGGKPGMEVSWELTGVRKDAYSLIIFRQR